MRLSAAVLAALLTSCSGALAAQIPRLSGSIGALDQAPPRDAQQPQPATGAGVIRGRVVAVDTGQPLRGARVSLSAGELRDVRAALTDDDGRYAFEELPAGRYLLQAAKGGYVSLSYGQRRAFESPRPLALSDGQTLDKVDFTLPRGGVVAGRVVDEFGEPAAEVMVQVGRLRYVGGQPQLTMAGRPATTDDRGEFRVWGLSPGEYYVSAGASPAAVNLTTTGSTGYATTYYPGTPSLSEALQLDVGLGQELTGIVFGLLRSRVSEIRGTVLDSSGAPAGQVMLMVHQTFGSAGGALAMASMRGGLSKPDGSFRLSGISPGEYTIDARRLTLGAPALTGGESASVDVTVTGSDITGLTLVLSAGATARGVVHFEHNEAPDGVRPTDVRLMAVATTPGAVSGVAQGTPEDDWSFELSGLKSERLIRAFVPQPWTLHSVSVNGVDTTDRPIDFDETGDVDGIEVLLTDRQTSVSGMVRDRLGNPVSDYVVVVFAEDAGRWGPQTRFVKIGRPDQEGRFDVRGLPPERYLAVAVEYLERGEETNPDTLEFLRTPATRLSIADGESRVLDLELTSF